MAWNFLAPLAMIFVYIVIFSQVLRARLPGSQDQAGYGVFLCAGIFTWGYFTDVLNRCIRVFVDQANLIKKTAFPRSSLPLIALFSATLDFAIPLGFFLLFLLVAGRFPGWAILGAVPLLVLQQTMALGMGVLLGTLNVFFRDVGQFMAIVLQFWFWLTPIVYPTSILPEWAVTLQQAWNPMAAIIVGYQDAVLTGAWPDPARYVGHAALAVVLLGAGFWAFRRLAGEMVDEL
jgi:lipopolysaccharide transport system permease protein